MTKDEAVREIEFTVRTGYVNWKEYMVWIMARKWIGTEHRFENDTELERRLVYHGEMQKYWRDHPSPRFLTTS